MNKHHCAAIILAFKQGALSSHDRHHLSLQGHFWLARYTAIAGLLFVARLLKSWLFSTRCLKTSRPSVARQLQHKLQV